ncbi:hypothetical protein WDW89_14815 [Deltaproteobacteria bacterium TL4]
MAETPTKKRALKVVRNLHPIALHLVKAYETSFRMGFLLNKEKAMMGSSNLGYALQPAAIGRLRRILEEDKEMTFLPLSLSQFENDNSLAEKLSILTGQSVLEYLGESLKKLTKQLIPLLLTVDVQDTSEHNREQIIRLFQRSILKGPAKGLTAFKLLRQIQQNLMAVRQRMQLELDMLSRVRKNTISMNDCFHALSAPTSLEVRGRISTAESIHLTLQILDKIKKSAFSGTFHPKITLDRSIQNLKSWGPGTPPRKFVIKEHPVKGKIPVPNEKLKEQLAIFKESAERITNKQFKPINSKELFDEVVKELKKYCRTDAPEAKKQGAVNEVQKDQQEGASSETLPEVVLSVEYANVLSLPEIIRFYKEKRQDSELFLLQGLYFELAAAQLINSKMLTYEHIAELRELLIVLQIDLSHAVDLYQEEVEHVIEAIETFTKKAGVQSNVDEINHILLPAASTKGKTIFKAIELWTKDYTNVLKKYVILNDAIQAKLIEGPENIEYIISMTVENTIKYIEHLQAIHLAYKKGYISDDQKVRLLDTEQTSDQEIESITAFFKAMEQHKFEKQSKMFTKGIHSLLEYYQGLLETDASRKNLYTPIVKGMEDLLEQSNHKQIIQDFLEGALYQRKPEHVDLLVQRFGHAMQLKLKYESFNKQYGEAMLDLTKALKGTIDFELYNVILNGEESEEEEEEVAENGLSFEELDEGESSQDQKITENPAEEFEEIAQDEKEQKSFGLLEMLDEINGSEEACDMNVFHNNDNSLFRRCLLSSFRLGCVNETNIGDLVGLGYCVNIMVHFQISFFAALRKVFILDAEINRSEDGTNSLGVSKERVEEMKQQCEAILLKQMPISFALKNLEAIWQTLDKNKVISRNAKEIAELQQKWDGNVRGGASLQQRLKNNPENVELLEEYSRKAKEAVTQYHNVLQDIANKLREWKRKQKELPSHIREYQRQIMIMERSIIQTMEEIKTTDPLNLEDLKKQIQEKQQRCDKYRKILQKYKADHPAIVLEIP